MEITIDRLYDPRITVFHSTSADVDLRAKPGWYSEVQTCDGPLHFGPKRTRLGARRLAANYLARAEIPA